MQPTELKKVLKKMGIDSPLIGRKNLTAAVAIQLLKDNGKIAQGEQPKAPSVLDTFIIQLPVMLFSLPGRLFSKSGQENDSEQEKKVN